MHRTLIGLTAYVESVRHGDWTENAAFVPTTYTEAVTRCGGVPILLPPTSVDAKELLSTVDGLIVIGGPDVGPSNYGADPHPQTDTPRIERDDWELELTRTAISIGLPLLSICRGLQVLNVALGGTLHQHLDDVLGPNRHLEVVGQMSPNSVAVEADSDLAGWLGPRADVLCHHHQAIDRLADGLEVVARSDDGIIEAVRVKGPGFGLGVQWHPEEDPTDDRVFLAFVDQTTGR